MMALPLLVAAHLVAAVLAPPLVRRLPRGGPLILSLVPAAGAAWLAAQIPAVAAGATPSWSHAWVPALDLHLSLRLDPLGLAFALLVCGVGAAVVVFGGGYLRGKPIAGATLGGLLAFAAAMLGLVLADDLLWLFICWEATSLASYLLVGLEYDRPEARAAARRALLVTAGGGLALLGGLVALGLAAGTGRISALDPDALGLGPIAHAAVALAVLLGAATKSAQFPFHFWLPGAMTAPTPVSAFLHSATMVKAGVYLVLRLGPALDGSPVWQSGLLAFGGVTALVAGVLALTAVDLKRLLACTTIGALGTMMLLVGVGTPEARGAALGLVLAHGLYKGALFMVAGGIKKASGSLDLRDLGGLGRAQRPLAVAAALAALSMAGLPPLMGFAAKETALAAILAGGLGGLVAVAVLAAMVLAGGAFVYAALAIAREPFATRAMASRDGITHDTDGMDGTDTLSPQAAAPAMTRLLPWMVVAPPLTLALLGLAAGLLAAPLGRALLDPVGGAPTGLAAWHGFGLPLALSAASVAFGALLWTTRARLRRVAWIDRLADPTPHDRAWDALIINARHLTALIQPPALRAGLAAVVLSAAGLATIALARLAAGPLADGTLTLTAGPTPDAVDWLLAAFLLGGALGAALARHRLGAIAALGAVGIGAALFFLRHGAPDLAMTQLLVEALTVVLLVLALGRLPDLRPARRGAARVWSALVALSAGLVVGALAYVAGGVDLGPGVSGWFAEQSMPAGHGRNVVNVILVDFRALDTLGEIAVLGVAALGVGALLARRGADRQPEGES